MKLRLISIALVALALSACNKVHSETEYVTEHRCETQQERERLAKFVADCASVNNDNVYKCQYAGENILCPERTYKATYDHTGRRSETLVVSDETQ